MRYWPNLLSMSTRWFNALFGGNRNGESTSSAVCRKAMQGRRLFIVAEALIDLAFAVLTGERHHCLNNLEEPDGRGS